MQRMCAADLLSHAEESALFREMNLAKHHALELRSQLDAEQPKKELLDAIESLLERATEVRELLIIRPVRTYILKITFRFA